MKRKVVCPNCHEGLTLTFKEGANIETALIKCPKCSYKATLALYQQGCYAQGGNGDSEECTQLNLRSVGQMDRTIGSLFIDGKEFALKKGRTLIGRKASSGTADLQIPTSDMYMSRRHAIITVKDGMSGLEHQLEPANPKNPIKLNGHILEQGDIVILNWGDQLTFGHTMVMFERPQYNEDEMTIFES